MKKIKSLNVFGQKIKISHKKMDEDYLGLFYPAENRIEINVNCPKEKLEETIIHELFHATFKRSALDQCHISSDAQEIIVEQFAKVICENFKLTKK